MKILARKHLSALHPIDDAGRDALAKISGGDIVTVEIKRPRNVKHHQKYWALVGLVWENVEHDRYPSMDDLHAAIKIAVGLRTRIELPNGAVGFVPGSISFNKMDQTEFDAFYDKVCDAVAKWFLPGVSDQDLKREVESMIGARAA